MLCRVWQSLVEAAPQAMAVLDAASGQVWTRGELAAVAGELPRSLGPVVAEGKGVAFLAGVLRAFADGVPLVLQDQPGALPEELQALPQEVAVVKMTSGSTGHPRYVLCSADQVAADAVAICSTMGLRQEWPNLAVISMSHSYGFSNLVLPLLLHGIPLVYVSSPLPGAMEQALGRVSRCTLPAVPAMWRTWHSAGILDEKIALAISAGAPLPVALESAIYMDCGLKVHNFYGSSECGGIAYDRSEKPRQDAACTGAPMDGVSVSTDEQGHLLVQGPAVASGYLHADPSLSGGIFRTSDTVEIREGLVYLTGRTGDVINVAGRKIAPGGIEEALSAVPGVMHCVVFGVPSADALRGDEIIACLSLRPGVEMSDIRRAAASCLPATQMPRHWWHRPDLAPDVRGKLSRAKWRQCWLDGGGESC